MSVKSTGEELEHKIGALTRAESDSEDLFIELDGPYLSILNTINDCVIVQSAAGIILSLNKAAEKFFNISAGDVIGQKSKDWDLIYEDGSKCNSNDLPFIKTLQTGNPSKNKIIGVRKTPDDLRWISMNTSPLFRKKDNNPSAVVISFSDITELKVAKDTSQYYLDTAGVMLLALNDTGEIILINKKGCEILERAENELLGKNWFELFTPKDKINEAKSIYHKMITGQIDGLDYAEREIITGSGARKLIAFNNTIIKDKDGKITGSLSSAEDITERKQIETEIRKNETRFRQLAELLPEAVFEADVEMNINYVNRQALSMFGYSHRDFKTGLNGMDMLAPKDRKRAKETFFKRIQGEISGAVEYSAIKKDGTIFPILFHASPIIENDSISGLRGIIIDISNIKMMEKRLIEAQKMESIGTLAGGIAHDFNNILSPIILHSEMTKNDLPEGDPLQVSIQEIYKASIRARDLVRQILTFARKGPEKKILVSTSKIVKDTIKFLRSTIPSTIEIRYENRATQDTILADPIQINQIVMNLCTNAAHAMRKEGGLLEVTLDNRDISSEDMDRQIHLQPGRYLEMTVRDSGTGIPQSIADKIFEPYFTTKGPGEGTGLGLSIIHGIVKSSGGGIDVDSKKGRGTTFYIYLPLKEEAITGNYLEEADTPRGTESILLVDDEEAGINAMQRTLTTLGYRVIPRTGSIEALETFHSNPEAVDLVITDMTMPAMTGIELIDKLKKMKPDLPTILCTGFSDQVDENEAERLGIDAFIMKPVVRSEIANAIRKVLGARNT